MACNDPSNMSAPAGGSSCYPTGCTPCDSAIDFPDSPTDGQRFCKTIGADGGTKCWVYDKCVPAWRAEGPSASPTRFRGSVDVKTQKPGFEDATKAIQAGDWYIQSVNADKDFQPEWGTELGDSVKQGDRIAFSGTTWQKLAPPQVPFAEEAIEGDIPDPDTRGGGIVKLATSKEAEAGTNKCDAITPFTLKKFVDKEVPDFTPTKPSTVTVTITQGNTVQVCVTQKRLQLNAEVVATTSGGNPALGRPTYQWIETTSGSDVNLDGETNPELDIDPFDPDPDTATRKFKCKVTWIDLFSASTIGTSTETTASLIQALRASGEPAGLDLSSNTTGTMTFTVENVSAELGAITPTFQWQINGIPITGSSIPADTGYTFANFTTNVLTINRTAEDAGNFTVTCKAMGGSCNGEGLVSANALLKGPGGSDAPQREVPTELGAIGTYRMTSQGGTNRQDGGNPGVGTVINFSGNLPPNYYTSPGAGTWRCMGYHQSSGGQNVASSVLWLRIS